MDTESVVFFIIGIVAIVVIVAFVAMRARKRTEAIAAVAKELGFSFEGKEFADPARAAALTTPLFRVGSTTSRAFCNIMSGESDGLPLSVFDYSYTVRTGMTNAGAQAASKSAQAVVAFFKPDSSLPNFILIQVGLAQKLRKAFGVAGLAFDSHPDFARRYQLSTSEEEATRALFTPALLEYLIGLDATKKWRFESSAPAFVVYRSGKQVKPADLKNFVAETSAIAGSFLN